MTRNIIPIWSLVLGALCSQAATVYWDNNGTSAGAGGATPSANWSSAISTWGNSTGTGSVAPWVDGDTAVFAAGTDATGSYIVTLVNPVTVAGIIREEGSPTIAGNNVNLLTFASGNLSVDSGAGPLVINAFYAPANGVVTKTGTGILSLGTTQTSFAGKWICNQGTLSFLGDLRIGILPGVPDQITLNGARLRSSTAGAVFDASRGIVLGAAGGGFNQTVSNVWNGIISGTSGGNLIFDGGANTLVTVLGGANTYDGNTAITNGSVLLGASGVIPDTSVVILGASGTKFDLNGFDETVKSILGSAGTIALGTRTLTINNPNGESFSSVISGTGGGKIVKNGSGKLTLSASTGTYDGGVTLNAGTLGIGANPGFGTGPLTINNSVTLAAASTGGRAPNSTSVILNGDLTFDDSFVATPGTFTWGSGTLWTIKGANRSINVNTVAGNYVVTINGVIGQDVAGRGLTKIGNGILAFGAVNTYSGDTTVNAGTLQLGGTGTIGDGTGTLHLSGGGLNTSASKSPSTSPVANPIDLTTDAAITTTSTAGTVDLNLSSSSIGGSGTLTFRNDAASGSGVFQPRFSAGGLTISLPLVINNGVSATTLLQSFNALGTSQTFSGVISGTGSYKRNASGGNTGGDTIFAAANTYSGGAILGDGGIGLGINSAGAPPVITSGPIGTGTLSVTPSANNAILFAAGGARLLGNAIAFTGSPLIISGTNALELSGAVALGAATRTITVNNTGPTTISGVISSTGGGLTKSGSGALTLTAESTYSGGTTISNGALVVASLTGSATGPGTVTVAASGTLAGNGSIAGSVDLSGTISPGGSPGTLGSAAENWNGGGHYLWQINNATNAPGADPGWGLLNITGGLYIAATASNKFTIDVASLASTNVPGLIDGFDAAASNVWLIAQTTDGITNFDAHAFHIVQTGFSNDLGGQIFAIAVDNDTNLVLSLKTNSAPSLTIPSDQTIDELTTLTVTNTASDPDPGTTLTFSLISPPTGMTINPATGVITWTPSEPQGPGSYLITVVVSDDAQTPLTATNTFNVTVNEVNSAPSITGPGNQTINELTTLNVSASATDLDIPANTLTYSLDTAPSGMTIDSGTGAMSWTTTEADGPGVYTVKVAATDNGTPPLSATNTFTVTVNEVNSAPSLTVPANQTINEQTALNVSASATDSDIPANILAFSLPSAPAGMAIDPNTGAISWTPAESDGPAVYTIKVAVTDNGTPPLSGTNSFTVTVNGVNNAPSVFVPADQTIDELTALNVSASATDPDVPANALVFSLGSHPSGMTIVPGTGAISWTPTEAQGPATNVVEVIVTDNGVPPLSATNAFTVVVREANTAPSLTVAADQTIDELTSLNVTNTATDSDLPANTLVFSLGDHPTGMTITPDTGIINWTPTEAQGPSSNLVEVIVTDDGSPVLSTTNTFVVMVNEVNSAPSLTVPANQTINELSALSVSASASDADLPANTLTFSLPSAPAGMAIDPNTGAINWTPTEADGPAVYTIDVAVTDDGSPALSVTNSFTVTVNEVNTAPTLTVPSDQTINELTALNVSASATDPDLPANSLTFSLGAHPSGMTIVPGTGAIAWTPTEAQGPATNVIEVIVTDDGLPALSVTNAFTVTVNEVNVAPSLTVPADQTIDELTSLNVTNTATDADLPANVLTFTLGNHPTGMTITPDTGIISWTPTEAQGPSSNLVEVVVTDDGSPALSTTNSFVVMVNEVNSAPTFAGPGDQTINELTTLNVSSAATDSDLPANTLTYALLQGPAGLTLDTNTGAILWPTTEADGPGVYTVSVAVTDDGTPPLSATNTLTVTVNEVNTAPQLTVPADQTINELATLNISVSATDSDLPANAVTFSLLAAPAGMTIVPGTGAISWTPTEAQGPTTNVITVVVADNGTPPLSATNSFTITVTEVNTAPSLPAIADRTIHAGQTLTFTNSATDSDLPANTLTYSLDSGAPATASVDASSGVFTWATTASDTNTTNAITVRVTDDGTPALDDSKSFTVTVVSAPTADISVAGNIVTINWTSISGQTYRVQYKNNIDDATWADLAPDVVASGSTASTTDTITSQRFYRVAVLP